MIPVIHLQFAPAAWVPCDEPRISVYLFLCDAKSAESTARMVFCIDPDYDLVTMDCDPKAVRIHLGCMTHFHICHPSLECVEFPIISKPTES